jgi:hypothetical protein
MKHLANDRRDLQATIAINVAKMLPKGERIASVKGLLSCDEDEARYLIARGRRLEKAKERAA